MFGYASTRAAWAGTCQYLLAVPEGKSDTCRVLEIDECDQIGGVRLLRAWAEGKM